MSLHNSSYGVPKIYIMPKVQSPLSVLPHPPKKEQEATALFYAMERIQNELALYLPAMTMESQQCQTSVHIHMEERINELMKELFQHKSMFYDKVYNEEDKDLWKKFGKAFLTIALETYNSVKWQVYYAAGSKMNDVSYDAHKRKAAISPQVLGNGRAKCAVSGVEDVESAFDIHHINKRFLWGISTENMLIKIHREFHTMIHKLTDHPEEEKRIILRIQNYYDHQLRSALVAINEKIQNNTHAYVENIFRMEEYMHDQKEFYLHPSYGGAKKSYARFIVEHADKADHILKNYVCEMASQLIESIPFFLHNMRIVNSYEQARYKAHMLNVTRSQCHSVLEKIEKLRPGDVVCKGEQHEQYQDSNEIVNAIFSGIKTIREMIAHLPERHVVRKEPSFYTMDAHHKAYPHATPKMYRLLHKEIKQVIALCEPLVFPATTDKKELPLAQYLNIEGILSETEVLCINEGARVEVPLHVAHKKKKKQKAY